MPDGYLYTKLEDVLKKIKTTHPTLDEISKELARRFRLTRKDVINVLRELEREKKVFIRKKRKIFVELHQGAVHIFMLIRRWFA